MSPNTLILREQTNIGDTRETLIANRTYYVRTDGNDSNDGLTNTSGGAFLTIQKAFNVLSQLDAHGHIITIQLGDGTYTAGGTMFYYFWTGGLVYLQGNPTTPSNVLIQVADTVFSFTDGALGGVLTIQDMELRSTTNQILINLQAQGQINISNLILGQASYQLFAGVPGAIIKAIFNYKITGAISVHAHASYGGVILLENIQCNFTNAVNPMAPFCLTDKMGMVSFQGCTFPGVAQTGIRYSAETNSLIWTNGGGATFLPGNSAGSVSNGGVYA